MPLKTDDFGRLEDCPWVFIDPNDPNTFPPPYTGIEFCIPNPYFPDQFFHAYGVREQPKTVTAVNHKRIFFMREITKWRRKVLFRKDDFMRNRDNVRAESIF